MSFLMGACPNFALVQPVPKRERATTRTVAGIRQIAGSKTMDNMGKIAPMAKARKLDIAACQGLVNSSTSMPYFSSTKALSGSCKKARLVKSWAEVLHSPFWTQEAQRDRLAISILFQKFSLSSHCSLLSVLLSGDGYIFPACHRKGASKGSSQTRQENNPNIFCRTGYPDDHPCDRNNTVVSSQNSRPQHIQAATKIFINLMFFHSEPFLFSFYL